MAKNKQDIISAVKDKDYDRVRELLENGADVNASENDEHGNPLITLAGIEGDVEMVKLLLEYNPDINLKNKTGWTPVQLSLWCGEFHMGSYTAESLEIVKMLEELGAEYDSPFEIIYTDEEE